VAIQHLVILHVVGFLGVTCCVLYCGESIFFFIDCWFGGARNLTLELCLLIQV